MSEQHSDRLAELSAAGVSVWLDDLSRSLISSGGLADLMATCSVVGVTTNPTIFAGALRAGDGAYDAQLAALARDGVTAAEAVTALTVEDVRAACDVLRPVFDATGTVDGRVSLEVSPELADQSEETLDEARRLWRAVARPNLFIKIPATTAGLSAIAGALAEGISVNVTLIFGIARYRQVMAAFLDGMTAARAGGLDLATIGSVASFFISRVDSAVDSALAAVDGDEAPRWRGQAGVANARLAFAAYQDMFGSPRWAELAMAGARPQRPLWASTGVKDPAYPDTLYVSELVTRGVVNTMPRATMTAFADHGPRPTDTVVGRAGEAAQTLAAIERLGISVDQITDRLEREGVEKFAGSWKELTEAVAAGLTRTGPARR